MSRDIGDKGMGTVYAAMPERSFALPLGRYSAHELRATGTRAPAALRMTCLADTTVSIIKDMV